MTSREEALVFKGKGNQFFQQKKYEEAVEEFSKAIELDATDHVFYSNRSACLSSLGRYEEALSDGQMCITLKPNWVKGYGRKGLALFHMDRLDEALESYNKGLELAPENQMLLSGKESVESKIQSMNDPMGNLFGPEIWAKIAGDPKMSTYLNDPDFVQKVQMLQNNPQSMGMMLGDPKIQQLFGLLTGIDFSAMGNMGADGEAKADGDIPQEDGEARATSPERRAPSPEPAQKHQPETQPEPVIELSPEEQEAQSEKDLGNKCYKVKDFDAALAHYNRAHELCPNNPIFLSNMAAVMMSMKQYKEAVNYCDQAIDLALFNPVELKTLAKIWVRKGNAFAKLGDLGAAIDAYNQSLVEHGDRAIQKKVKKLMAVKKKRDAKEYIDEEKSLHHKSLGAQHFKNGKWGDAIAEFTEAINRNPTDEKLYSNRSLCYVKFMEWGKAMEDAEKAIELNPQYVKPYLRKGKVQHFLKKYHKAIETYNVALEIAPDDPEVLSAMQETQMAIARSNMSGEVDPERQRRAMEDPEVQQIMNDPKVRSLLENLQSDPIQAQKAMADPVMRQKLEVLVAAGILQMR